MAAQFSINHIIREISPVGDVRYRKFSAYDMLNTIMHLETAAVRSDKTNSYVLTDLK